MFKKVCLWTNFAVISMIFFVFNCEYVSAGNYPLNKETKFVNTISQSDFSNYEIINKYQEKYFEIIKRNNVLLNIEDNAELNNDRIELDNLFNEIKTQITNKNYLNKYKKYQKKFSNCDEITTIGINKCAEKNYKAIDKLLNDVYKKAESKLNFEESKKLALNQIEWEKEVEDYKNIYNSMDFGTLGTSIYLGYETNMKEFRTLLLMLYL